MRITSKPVDVSALRQEWIEVVDRWADLSAVVDRKTQMVARRCCWANIAVDLRRYRRVIRIRLLAALFEDTMLVVELDHRIEYDGPEIAAAWLEEKLGVKL